MEINRDLILGDIVNRYGGKSYSSAKVALAYDCVFYAEEWLNRPTGVPINGRSKRQARKDLKKYVQSRIKVHSYINDRFYFIPSFLWWMLARAVINWVISKIIDEYL